MQNENPKFATLVTLGCRLNSADSALMTERLRRAGYEIVGADAPRLDLAVVNTCAVTAEAVRKSRAAARKLRRAHPECRIVAVGCAALLEPELWRGKRLADVVAGQSGKHTFADGPEEAFSPVFEEKAHGEFPFRSRAFLKIQEGCNNFCTYCIVPYVRGRERSRAFAEVLADAQKALDSGFRELVLTGVNTCAYDDAGRTLGALVREVAKLDGDFRIRLSSTEPHLNNRALLEVMADPANKICRFLHLSLQHGCDRILRAMHRKYTVREYADFVAEARRLIPDIHIGTDFIVGFPGETERDFEEALDFVRKTAFANTHIFTYSKRAGTPAAAMPDQVPSAVAEERAARLREIAEAAKFSFAASFVGHELPVIFEQEKTDGFVHGWSDNYIAVRAKQVDKERIVRVKIAAAHGAALDAEF